MRATSRICILSLVCLACLACLAVDAGARLRFGATAGLNRTSLEGDAPDDAKYKSAFGFEAGVLGEIDLTDDVILSLQPMYARRGTDIAFKVGEDEPRDSLEVRMDYIDCLAIIKVKSDGGRIYLSSGLGAGFLTKATLNDIRGGESNIKSAFKNYDVSVLFGVGYAIPARNTILNIELRYQQSLLSVADPGELASESGLAPRTRFSGFQIFATVLFPRNHD